MSGIFSFCVILGVAGCTGASLCTFLLLFIYVIQGTCTKDGMIMVITWTSQGGKGNFHPVPHSFRHPVKETLKVKSGIQPRK